MAIDLWHDDDEEITGEYVQQSGGGDFPLIPHDTRVLSFIDKTEWGARRNFRNREKEEDCIAVRFEIEEGEFKGRKISKNCFIKSDDDIQASKDYALFLNIDANAGGKIRSLRREPEYDDLQKYLINKQMVIVIGIMKGDGEKKKDFNYLMGVLPVRKKTESKREEAPRARPASPRRKLEEIDDDDIPF